MAGKIPVTPEEQAACDQTEEQFTLEFQAEVPKLKEVAAGTLLERACGPEDVADAVMSFVVYNRFVTGEVLSVTGGNK